MNTPLVSVVVISYNSSQTIEETLDSIRDQEYPSLELIISDDASQDDTIDIARAWLEKNRSRFVRAELLVAERNSGIPANLNRGTAASHGEFLKSIAADDILLPNCIKDNVTFMQENPEAEVCISRIQEFTEINGKKIFSEAKNICPSDLVFWNASPQEQYKTLLSECFIDAPALFIRMPLCKKFPYNELFPVMEDWPYWLTLTNAGIKLNFINKITVYYRTGVGVSSHPAGKFYKKPFMESQKLFYMTILRSELLRHQMQKRVAKFDRDFLLYDFIIAAFDNRRYWLSSLTRFFFRIFLHITVR